MKTAQDPRHKTRIRTVKELFSESFTKQSKHSKLTRDVLRFTDQIDQTIKESATEWPIEKLNKIDLAILRLAIYELLITKTPPKVIIDEAVELAKEFGSENSPSFVNGVLGTILKKIKKGYSK